MNDERKPRELDPRLHDYLDGELSPSDAAAFEGDLRPGNDTANQLRTLKHLGAWLRTTRPRTPSSLALSVALRLDAERHPAGAPRSSPALGRRWELGSALRWAWVPAMAALLVLAVIPMTRVLRPSDGLPKPSEDAATWVPRPVADKTASDTVPYEFTVRAAAATKVCLAGDFNDWQVCEAPMRRVGEDTWSITIDVPRGRHEYMFVIDDRWVPDPKAMGYADDGFGSRNSVLVV